MDGELEQVKNRMENDALAKHLGIKIKEIGLGSAVATMEVRPELLNGVGITHGGAIFSLADVVFAAASNSRGPVALALDVHICFLKATTAGEKLTASAQEENVTSRTGLYRMRIVDTKDELVAIAEGMVYRKK